MLRTMLLFPSPDPGLALLPCGFGCRWARAGDAPRLWGTVQHCALTPDFPEKDEGSSVISLNF